MGFDYNRRYKNQETADLSEVLTVLKETREWHKVFDHLNAKKVKYNSWNDERIVRWALDEGVVDEKKLVVH